MARDGEGELRLPASVWGPLNRQAEMHDLDTLPFAVAIIEGAFKLRQVERLVAVGLEGKTPKRRARKRLPWKAVGEGAGRSAAAPDRKGKRTAADWVCLLELEGRYAQWRIHRVGDPNSKTPAEGDGWYLTGPGVTEHGGTHVGMKRGEATDQATIIIRGWLEDRRGSLGGDQTGHGGIGDN